MYWIDTSDPGRLNSSDRQIAFWADDEGSLSELPTTSAPGVQQGDDTVSCKPVGKGSTCMVIGNGTGATLYVLNSNDEWVRM